MNAIEIRSKVDEILSSAGIKFTVRLVGETKRDDWECDQWRVSFGKFETDYYTGTGHRKPIAGAPSDKGNPRRHQQSPAPDRGGEMISSNSAATKGKQ